MTALSYQEFESYFYISSKPFSMLRVKKIYNLIDLSHLQWAKLTGLLITCAQKQGDSQMMNSFNYMYTR